MSNKLSIMALITVVLSITFVACNKSAELQPSELIEKTEISPDIETILYDLNHSTDRVPPWWEKFKKWVHDHSGSSQQWVNGQPSCHGNGGCGPCPGICFGGSIAPTGSGSGELTEEELEEGLRPFTLSVIESTSTGELRILLGFDESREDFIHNGVLIIEEQITVASELAEEAGFGAITLEPGQYEAFENQETRFMETVVTAIFE